MHVSRVKITVRFGRSPAKVLSIRKKKSLNLWTKNLSSKISLITKQGDSLKWDLEKQLN